MRIIETKVYPFSELSEDAKQKAIENLSDINVDFDWWTNVYQDAEIIGLKLTGFDLYRNDISGEFQLSASEVAQNIFNNHGKDTNTFEIAEEFMNEFNPVFAKYIETEEDEDDLIDMEDGFLNKLLGSYFKMLKEDYECLTTDEAIIETIESNGYEFTQDGKLI